jgi:hypothetical protein
MVRKRAPGGGRKPKGPFKNKDATLTTRITRDVREALDREADRNNRSLSQEVEYRLVQSLTAGDVELRGNRRNRALGYIVGRLAGLIEQETGENWRRDKFTFETVQSAIETMLFKLAPEGLAKIPTRVKRQAEHQARILARARTTMIPKGFAKTLALIKKQKPTPAAIGNSFAEGMLLQMEIMKKPPLNHSRKEHYAKEFYLMPDLRRDLEFKQSNP